ncbi:MlaE family ABC transporter permease [Mycolicibacterium holsaticum]|uniref:MlaE family ABC transporter permease n=1 Tax=Mycolicibacterium holsaticum TaxID=152142 RepID=UPI001C7DDCAC|nr:ABC transporter permease [Mycolicibacterium holsaticum]MDA4106956.1 ABC transporter permease [Mycolicibacterium holsaticum DSM 44478 = JCM 12374]QZA12363.1 ABC transporter permease [Mycolicibacterium holsaticum DSM 44478 = JCM 12374]UNC10152.1 ABC transporter permease [Mycolicibacterium holsaticum DSM 44478 = JCM 12374]
MAAPTEVQTGPPQGAIRVAAKPARALGNFFSVSLDILVQMVRPPFAWAEFIDQTWFVARVAILPAVLLSIPFNAFAVFLLNALLVELGAADLGGATAGVACVTQIAPMVTVLVVAGAGATAMCADLGARTIREEIDAMRVMGLDPVRGLLVPRVAALTVNALLLNAITTTTGLAADYAFTVYLQHVTPGAFASSLTLLVGLRECLIAILKAVLFGIAAGLIACYKGITVEGGPQGVGNAVNETVVFSFMTLFMINVLLTAMNAQMAS